MHTVCSCKLNAQHETAYIDHPEREAVGKAECEEQRKVRAAALRGRTKVTHGEVVKVTVLK